MLCSALSLSIPAVAKASSVERPPTSAKAFVASIACSGFKSENAATASTASSFAMPNWFASSPI